MHFLGEVVTSAQNKYVSLARMLSDKKRRDREGLFRFDGVKLLCEALRRGVKTEFLLISDTQLDGVMSEMHRRGLTSESIDCRVIVVKDSIFEKISSEKSPEGVICVAKYIDKFHKFAKINNEAFICEDTEAVDPACSKGRSSRSAGEGECDVIYAEGLSRERILLLESVRDPQNIGAVIRSAAALGATLIIMSDDCADIYNPKAVRASMGSLFSMRIIRVGSICDAVCALRRAGRRVFAAALDTGAQRLCGAGVCADDCVLIGNEGHGLSADAIAACGESIYIPMSMDIESLNAAVAASILLWEFFGRGN